MAGDWDLIAGHDGLAELLSRQHGLARRSQLTAHGISESVVRAQLEARRWQLVAPEVLSVDNGRLDRDQQRWRAVLHPPRAWLGGRSALEVLGLRGFEQDAVDVLVPRDARPRRLDGVVLHVSDRLDGLDPSLARGLPVVAAARAVVDAVAWSPHPRLAQGFVLDALRQRLTSVADVDAELARCGRIRHKVAARDALHAWDDGAESVAEMDVGPLLRRAGITTFRRQVRDGARRYDVEAVLADGTVLVVEVDGRAHDSAEPRWVDAWRDVETAAQGRIVVRVPAHAVRHDQARVVRALSRIAAAAEQRLRHR